MTIHSVPGEIPLSENIVLLSGKKTEIGHNEFDSLFNEMSTHGYYAPLNHRLLGVEPPNTTVIIENKQSINNYFEYLESELDELLNLTCLEGKGGFKLRELFNFFSDKFPNEKFDLFKVWTTPHVEIKNLIEEVCLKLFPLIPKDKIEKCINSSTIEHYFKNGPVQYVLVSFLTQKEIESCFFDAIQTHTSRKKDIKQRIAINNCKGCFKIEDRDTNRELIFFHPEDLSLIQGKWKISLKDLVENSSVKKLYFSFGKQSIDQAIMPFLFNSVESHEPPSPQQWLIFLWEKCKGARILNKNRERILIESLSYLHKPSQIHTKIFKTHKGSKPEKIAKTNLIFFKKKFISEKPFISIYELIKKEIQERKDESDLCFTFIFQACVSLSQYSSLCNDDIVRIFLLIQSFDCKITPPIFYLKIECALIDYGIPFKTLVAWLTITKWFHPPAISPMSNFINQNAEDFFNALQLFEQESNFLNQTTIDYLHINFIDSNLDTEFMVKELNPGLIDDNLKNWIHEKLLFFEKNPYLSFLALIINFFFPLSKERLHLIFHRLPYLLKGAPNGKIDTYIKFLEYRCSVPDYKFAISSAAKKRSLTVDQWILCLLESENLSLIEIAYTLWKSLSQPKDIASSGIRLFNRFCCINPLRGLAFLQDLFLKNCLSEDKQLYTFLSMCSRLENHSLTLTEREVKQLADLAYWVFSYPHSLKFKNFKEKESFKKQINFFIRKLHEYPNLESSGDRFLLMVNRKSYDFIGEYSEQWMTRLEVLVNRKEKSIQKQAVLLFHLLIEECHLNKIKIDANRWKQLLIHVNTMLLRFIPDAVYGKAFEEKEFLTKQGPVKELLNHLCKEKTSSELKALCHYFWLPLLETLCQQVTFSEEDLNDLSFLLSFVPEEAFIPVSHFLKKMCRAFTLNIFNQDKLSQKKFEAIITDRHNLKFFSNDLEITSLLLCYLHKTTDVYSSESIKNKKHLLELILIKGKLDPKTQDLSFLFQVLAQILSFEKINPFIIELISKYQNEMIYTLNKNENWPGVKLILKNLNMNSKRENWLGHYGWNLCKYFLKQKDSLIKENIYDILIHESKEQWLEIDFSLEKESLLNLFHFIFSNFKTDDPKLEFIHKYFISIISEKNEWEWLIHNCLELSENLNELQLLRWLQILPLSKIVNETHKEEFHQIVLTILQSAKTLKSNSSFLEASRFLLLNNGILNFFEGNKDELYPHAILEFQVLFKEKEISYDQLNLNLELINTYEMNFKIFWDTLWEHIYISKNKELIDKGLKTFFCNHLLEKEFPQSCPKSLVFVFKALESVEHPDFFFYYDKITPETILAFEDNDSKGEILKTLFKVLIKDVNDLITLQKIHLQRSIMLGKILFPDEEKEINDNKTLGYCETKSLILQAFSSISNPMWLLDLLSVVDEGIIYKYFSLNNSLGALNFSYFVLQMHIDFNKQETNIYILPPYVIKLINKWFEHYEEIEKPDDALTQKALFLFNKSAFHGLDGNNLIKMISKIIKSSSIENYQYCFRVLCIIISKLHKKQTKALIDLFILIINKYISFHKIEENSLVNYINFLIMGSRKIHLSNINLLKAHSNIIYAGFYLFSKKYHENDEETTISKKIKKIAAKIEIDFFESFAGYSNNFELLMKIFKKGCENFPWFNSEEVQLFAHFIIINLIKSHKSYNLKFKEVFELVKQTIYFYSEQIDEKNYKKEKPIWIRTGLLCQVFTVGLSMDEEGLFREEFFQLWHITNKKFKDEAEKIKFFDTLPAEQQILGLLKVIKYFLKDKCPRRTKYALEKFLLVRKLLYYNIPQISIFKNNIINTYDAICHSCTHFSFEQLTIKKWRTLAFLLMSGINVKKFSTHITNNEVFQTLKKINFSAYNVILNILENSIKNQIEVSNQVFFLHNCLNILENFYLPLITHKFIDKNEYLEILSHVEKLLPIVYSIEIQNPCLLENMEHPYPLVSTFQMERLITALPLFYFNLKTEKQKNELLKTPRKILFQWLLLLKNTNQEGLKNGCFCFIKLFIQDRQRTKSLIYTEKVVFKDLFEELKEKFYDTASPWQKCLIDLFYFELLLDDKIRDSLKMQEIYFHLNKINLHFHEFDTVQIAFCDLASMFTKKMDEQPHDIKEKSVSWLIVCIAALTPQLKKTLDTRFRKIIFETLKWIQKTGKFIDTVELFEESRFF